MIIDIASTAVLVTFRSESAYVPLRIREADVFLVCFDITATNE